MFRQEKLTSPFTGNKFVGTFDGENHLHVTNPLTGASYDFKIHGNAITIPLELFNYIETVSFKEAEKILEVSQQRISKIAKDNVIPTYKVNGKKCFKLSDIIRYKNLRKVGKPTKE